MSLDLVSEQDGIGEYVDEHDILALGVLSLAAVVVVVLGFAAGWTPLQILSGETAVFTSGSIFVAVRALRISKRSKEQSVSPTLVFDFALVDGDPVPAIVNVGNGPALQVEAKAKLVPERGTDPVSLPYRSVLKPGERIPLQEEPIDSLVEPDSEVYKKHDKLYICPKAIKADGDEYCPVQDDEPLEGQQYELEDLQCELRDYLRRG